MSFTHVSKTEAIYGMSRVNVKGYPGSTFTFTGDLSYIKVFNKININ